MSGFEYYRKGFGLRKEIRGAVTEDYASDLVDLARENENRIEVGDLTILLAKEFGFCYGVDRAVDLAYETHARFPDRRIFLSGQIIHNPRVDHRLREMGIEVLEGEGLSRFGPVEHGDIVLIPAFGCSTSEFEELKKREIVVVDTTCGSVLRVWLSIERFAKRGFTSLVHGKYRHEEARATCSRAVTEDGGRYVVVADLDEARILCDTIEGKLTSAEFMERLGHAVSDGFDPDRDLLRIGCANQTTMLSSESLAVTDMVRAALTARHGADDIDERFSGQDTICSATQDRQDAVRDLIAEDPNLVVVTGGYNSSNTGHLAEIASEAAPTFHVDRVGCLISKEEIRHRPVGMLEETVTRDWLPAGPATIGVTAGASTPNSEVGGVLDRILRFRGIDPASLTS